MIQGQTGVELVSESRAARMWKLPGVSMLSYLSCIRKSVLYALKFRGLMITPITRPRILPFILILGSAKTVMCIIWMIAASVSIIHRTSALTILLISPTKLLFFSTKNLPLQFNVNDATRTHIRQFSSSIFNLYS